MSSGALDITAAGLLTAASLVLRAKGFEVRLVSAETSGQQMLLAEDDLFLLGLVEFSTAESLPVLEGHATLELAEYLEAAGAKRWDAYLVMLTALPSDNQQMSAAIADILYNTRYVRRIIRWGLAADPDAMTAALRPFFALPALNEGGRAEDPVWELADRMAVHGIAPSEAHAAINRWLQTAQGRDHEQ